MALIPGLMGFLLAFRQSPKIVALTYLLVFASGISAVILFEKLFPEKGLMHILCLKQKDFIGITEDGVYLSNENNTLFLKGLDTASLNKTAGKDLYKIKPGISYPRWQKIHVSDSIRVNSADDTASYRLLWYIPKIGSKIHLTELRPDIFSFVRNAPEALFHSLMRPLPGESFSPFLLLASGENVFLILLIPAALIFRKRKEEIPFNDIFFCLSFAIVLLLIVGWTTPVMGAIVRYRMPALPFYLTALSLLLDFQKIKQ